MAGARKAPTAEPCRVRGFLTVCQQLLWFPSGAFCGPSDPTRNGPRTQHRMCPHTALAHALHHAQTHPDAPTADTANTRLNPTPSR